MAGSTESSSLNDLSLEQLSNVKVTSISRKPENLFQAPAAIFVITGEEIRRGGFTTLPDALRMVPGLYVVQINPHQWEVSARGFGDLENNKMLVLVDGRSVYTPLYGGVFWDVLDLPLEDIDRVEIIRGPGGSLWGANAMNGVINIVMKPAEKTTGALVSTSADLDQGYTSLVQYGGTVSRSFTYRIFGKASYWEPYNSAAGFELPNNFDATHAGVRADWEASSKNTFSLEAETYDGRFRSVLLSSDGRINALLKGSDFLLRWKHVASNRSNLDVLTYCDWHTRTGIPAEKRNTCDIEFQHNYTLTDRQSIIWGGSFLSTVDDLTQDPAPYTPEKFRNSVVSGLVQYDLAIVPSRFRILLGTKLEHNDYTGFEYQPQGRAVWTPNQLHTVWASISRAIRSPARDETSLKLVLPEGDSNGVPVFLYLDGNAHLMSETLKAYELGYRYQPKPSFSIRSTAYYNDYKDLISESTAIPEIHPDATLLKTSFINEARAQTHGLESSVTWQPVHRWTLALGITELRGSPIAAMADPHHIFNVLSRLNLPRKISFDSSFYHYSSVPLQNSGSKGMMSEVAGFSRLDIGISWPAAQQWTLALWGRNLQSDHHLESLPTSFGEQSGEIPRSVSFKILWRQKAEGTRP